MKEPELWTRCFEVSTRYIRQSPVNSSRSVTNWCATCIGTSLTIVIVLFDEQIIFTWPGEWSSENNLKVTFILLFCLYKDFYDHCYCFILSPMIFTWLGKWFSGNLCKVIFILFSEFEFDVLHYREILSSWWKHSYDLIQGLKNRTQPLTHLGPSLVESQWLGRVTCNSAELYSIQKTP